jgi:predicted nucleotidyltransferase
VQAEFVKFEDRKIKGRRSWKDELDFVMLDGKWRSCHQAVDAIIEQKKKDANSRSLVRIPTKQQAAMYMRTRPWYEQRQSENGEWKEWKMNCLE